VPAAPARTIVVVIVIIVVVVIIITAATARTIVIIIIIIVVVITAATARTIIIGIAGAIVCDDTVGPLGSAVIGIVAQPDPLADATVLELDIDLDPL